MCFDVRLRKEILHLSRIKTNESGEESTLRQKLMEILNLEQDYIAN